MQLNRRPEGARAARARSVQMLSVEEARELFDNNSALFVDVRKPEFYERVRIPGAVSIPMKGPAERFWTLPDDRPAVIY